MGKSAEGKRERERGWGGILKNENRNKKLHKKMIPYRKKAMN